MSILGFELEHGEWDDKEREEVVDYLVEMGVPGKVIRPILALTSGVNLDIPISSVDRIGTYEPEIVEKLVWRCSKEYFGPAGKRELAKMLERARNQSLTRHEVENLTDLRTRSDRQDACWASAFNQIQIGRQRLGR